MHSPLTEKEVRTLLDNLKQNINSMPSSINSLDVCLDSAAKHIPAYLKILKGHIEQLAKVLEMETHDQRKLENVGLAAPVNQLMQLFRELNEEDIQLLEMLSFEARHWNDGKETNLPREISINAERVQI